MLKAIIFDFDGVMVDSEPLHCEAFRQVLADRGIKLSKDEYYTNYLGYSDYDCVAEVCKDFDIEMSQEEVDELIRVKTEVFEGLAKGDGCLISGVNEFVASLKGNGIRMAICSGALRSDIELMLKCSDFESEFETIVSADDVIRSKPDPESYVKALGALKSKYPELQDWECLVIEDSHWGLAAARAAGLKCIGVTNTYSAEALDGSADVIVDNLSELNIERLHELCREE